MRLGDVDKLLYRKRKVMFFGLGQDDECWGFAVHVEEIDKAPTIDAVPVVRCRECRFWEKQEWGGAIKLGDPIQQGGKCKIHVFGALENDFCSRGQRKEADHD